MHKKNSAINLILISGNRLAAFCLMCMFLLGCGQTMPADTLIINNVTVIDATGAAPQPGRSVRIIDGVIESIDPITEITIPKGVTVIDASGMFLVPGFWDMHVHANQEFYLPLFIANGVTGVREMWGRDIHHEWRKRIGEEGFISPRFYIASSIIDGDPPRWPGSTVVNNAEEARKEVNRFYQLGSDFIKVYESLNRDAYYAIVDECKKLGITFVGHVPQSITFPEAISAGQKSMEHLLQFELYVLNNNKNPEELYQMLLENDTWSCPTLAVHRNYAYKKDRKELDKDRLVYIPQPLADSWRYDRDPRMKNFSKNQWEAAQRFYEIMKKQVTGMNKAGVRILAGTDVSNPYCFPGFSLHDEFALLVEAGLTPMQALQASTRSAAEFMGKLDTMGTVEEGKTADLILLRANPLEDIHNTTKIEAVIFDGHLYDRKDLDGMLENAKRAAAPGKTDALQSDKRFDGTWKGTVPGSDGTPLEITYEFESSGNYLSGTVATKLGEGPFTGGKIEGNDISFTVQIPDNTVYVNGTLSGDVINMIQKKGDEINEFTLKRVPENKKFDGTWEGTMPGPDGNPLAITFEYESDANNLTGTISTKLGAGPFSGGKIEGNQISFYVERGAFTVYWNGTISGDMINMTRKNGEDVKQFTVKRVTAGNDTAESALLSPDNSVIKEKAPFPGYLYRPEDNAAHPGIIFLHGSTGGNGDFNPFFPTTRTGENSGIPSLAREYARRGYVTYALCYFDCKHHEGYDACPPDNLKDIDIYKITYEAFLWLKKSDYVQNKKVAIWGASMGAEQSLLLASLVGKNKEGMKLMEPDAILAFSPPDISTVNITQKQLDEIAKGKEFVKDNYSAWIFANKKIKTGTPIDIQNYNGPVLITYFANDPINWLVPVNPGNLVKKYLDNNIPHIFIHFCDENNMSKALEEVKDNMDKNIIINFTKEKGHVSSREQKSASLMSEAIKLFLKTHLGA